MPELHTQFLNLLAGRDDQMELDAAAVELARLDHADVDAARVLSTLDEWADLIDAELPRGAGGAIYLATVNRVLFQQIRLRGDTVEYDAPENSCLDRVIDKRSGMPITLSLIYMEVARRLMRPVYGVALPAHFLCRFDDGLVSVYVDPFDQGELLTASDCLDRVEQLTGRRPDDSALTFAAATKRQILHRMINNLRNSYYRRGRNQDALKLTALQQSTQGPGLF